MLSKDIVAHILGFLPVPGVLAHATARFQRMEIWTRSVSTRRAKQQFAFLVASPCLLRFITKYMSITRSLTHYLNESAFYRIKKAISHDPSILSFHCPWVESRWHLRSLSSVYKFSQLITSIRIFSFHDSERLATTLHPPRASRYDIHVKASKSGRRAIKAPRAWLSVLVLPNYSIPWTCGFDVVIIIPFISRPLVSKRWMSNVDMHLRLLVLHRINSPSLTVSFYPRLSTDNFISFFLSLSQLFFFFFSGRAYVFIFFAFDPWSLDLWSLLVGFFFLGRLVDARSDPSFSFSSSKIKQKKNSQLNLKS